MLGCQNLIQTLAFSCEAVYLAAKLYAYSGFKRDVLISGVGEMCLKNGSVEPARPCCFPVLKGFFERSQKLLCLELPEKPAKTSIIVPAGDEM